MARAEAVPAMGRKSSPIAADVLVGSDQGCPQVPALLLLLPATQGSASSKVHP